MDVLALRRFEGVDIGVGVEPNDFGVWLLVQ